jgi:hypothetical protein
MLGNQGIMVLFLMEARSFSQLRAFISGAHPASYAMDTTLSFVGIQWLGHELIPQLPYMML